MISRSLFKASKMVGRPSTHLFRAFSSLKERDSGLDKQIQDQIEKDQSFFLSSLQLNQTEFGVEKKEGPPIEIVRRVQINDGALQNPEPQQTTLQKQQEEDLLPLSVRERRQTIQVYEVFKEKAKWGEFYRVYGLCLLLIGGYFLTVPFYNVLCQTFGFTMSQHAKDYRFADKEINVFRKYTIRFMGHTEDEIPWEFQPETTQLVVNAGETALAFYKVYNRSDKPIAGIAIYQVSPEEVSVYFNKIQCFCFENQLLYPQEQVDLPVLFYLDPAINHDPALKNDREIILTYHFFPSADQSVAQVLQQEIEKHQAEEKALLQKRRDLEKAGVVLPKMESAHGAITPGFNPKDSPESFVRKIMQNTKRIELTIKRYEEEQAAKASSEKKQEMSLATSDAS